MVICEHQDFAYDTAIGEKPACVCSQRNKDYEKAQRTKECPVPQWDPDRCEFVGRETQCKYFQAP